MGDYGIILISDDDGKHFRQASSVPVSSMLTSVSFANDKQGWAAGHWGVILNTEDGGEHWSVQRADTHEDRPLFSVHFFDSQAGIAVGLWSLVLVTRDGGKHWETATLPAPPGGGRADRNLFKVFSSPKGSAFIAAERGVILRSENLGKTWQYITVGYQGSFWTGIALHSGVLLVGGLRGTVYRSADDGKSWQAVPSSVKSSITDMVQMAGKVIAVGLDGVQIQSIDDGVSFTSTQRDDRLSLTSAVVGNNPSTLIRFSKRGIVDPASSR